jgi:sugar phosphate isomerase/epimerase
MIGINLCFAVKRYLEPEAWARFVREELDLTMVQFTFDLADPWWPDRERGEIVGKIRAAANSWGLTIHSAFVGLAHYVPGGLLDPDPTARRIAETWWHRAVDMAAALGVSAVGGPLGAMSVQDAANPAHAERRYGELLASLDSIGEHVRRNGLDHLLIEPTPIRREIPHTVEQCHRLATDLTGLGVPFGFALDTGHTVHEPLYGPQASAAEWIDGLGGHIRLVHLDNTDRQGDPHWGWPHPLGRFDVAAFARQLQGSGLADLPVVLEVYPRFEDDDDEVRAVLISSVDHCRTHFATVSG